MPKRTVKYLREPPDCTWNELAPDIHIGGSEQAKRITKCQIHVICNEHGYHVPCPSPKYRNGGEKPTSSA